MKNIRLNRRGQALTLDQFPNILIVFLLIGLIGAVTILLEGRFKDRMTVAEGNTSIDYAIEATGELVSWTPTIALILAVVFILGVVALIAVGRRQSI